IERLVDYPERMRENLESSGGLVNSQRVLLALTQAGMSREDAYAAVQRNAMPAWRGEGNFRALLGGDPAVAAHLDPVALDDLFDDAHHFRRIDAIFARVFGQD